MQSQCPSCCYNCRSNPQQQFSSSSDDPYHLNNLLKAGVVLVQLGRDSQPERYCEHYHADDGWHPYLGAAPFLPLTNLNDVNLCKNLEFLARHRFLSATYRIYGGGKLVFRIYLTPYDLPGARGTLRVRQENVMAPARRYLRSLLPMIEKSWEGDESEGADKFLQDTKDPRTLSEIYSDLASPKAKPVPGLGNISARLLDYDDNLEGLGLRSKLYRYQRRSVAAMIQRELDNQDVPDPLFVSLRTIDGKEFFYQPGTMEVLLERPMVQPCRGGILCEELGTGKTVMIISLVLATLKQLPKPEESMIDDRPVMTPLSFRYFPSRGCMTARSRMSFKGKERADRVPSLVEILLEHSRLSPNDSVPNLTSPKGQRRAELLEAIEDKFESLSLDELRKATVPFYFHYPREPTNFDRSRRQRSAEAPKRMYLSPATLVVVPPNLLGQWDREITKHAEYPLRVLILRDKSDMPSVRSLASDFNLILMTYTRFTAESKGSTAKLHSNKYCVCPEFPGSSVPDCQCAVPDVSPLLQIRWKRLVIDEGHVSSSTSTQLNPCSKALSIERKWIVTGTPTTNLLGLGLGQRIVEDLTDPFVLNAPEVDDDGMDGVINHDTYVLNNGDASSFSAPGSPSKAASPSPTPLRSPPSEDKPPTARIWDQDDRADLRKLGNMIAHFISVPQFAADPRLMLTHVTEPLLDPRGPRPGAIGVLNQLMEMVMVRHRVEDIEDDVVLPPLTHESVLLDLDPLAIKSYNALQASIAVNAIDSERKDIDYLFHPANSDLLQVTIKNMSQTMFWSVDENRYFVKELHKDADKQIQRAIERSRPPEDIALLRDALRHIAIAANDPVWYQLHSHEDVPYRVYCMPEPVYNAWTRITPHLNPADPYFSGFLSADRLLKLYDMILHKPLITIDGMIESGMTVSREDEHLRQLYLEAERKSSKNMKAGRKANASVNQSFQTMGATTHSQIVASAVKKASAKEIMDEVKAELKVSLMAEEDMQMLEVGGGSASAGQSDALAKAVQTLPRNGPSVHKPTKLSTLAHNSPLAKVRIGASASNKLNYIIEEVLKYSAKEKFLIFTDSELTLAHIAEALELVHVKYLRFSSQIAPRNREQLVLTFETSETYRVFLMELKHGARGLNLVSASRVIFCEPVWQADVESQAIKRVHRIGQTKAITVKTLAIRGTAEENMVHRRHALQHSNDKIPKLIEEAGMRHFISNPKFIETPPTVVNIDVPLLDLPPLEVTSSATIKIQRPSAVRAKSPRKRSVWLEDPLSGQDPSRSPSPGPSPKRQRTIRFAT